MRDKDEEMPLPAAGHMSVYVLLLLQSGDSKDLSGIALKGGFDKSSEHGGYREFYLKSSASGKLSASRKTKENQITRMH